MPYQIEDKLVIAVASSALFQLDEADEVFRTAGVKAYRAYQREHQHDVLRKGVAFPFIKRFLKLNTLFPDIRPVEVVLLSHNDPDTGQRVFDSIRHYKLDISRAAFTTGDSPYRYIPAYNVALFLSANEADVKESIREGFAAGQVLDSSAVDDDEDLELRIAFDFDGVLTDDSSELVYQLGGLEQFQHREQINARVPMPQGPLAGLLEKLARIRELEDDLCETDPAYKRYLKTAIVTARNAPADARFVTTLREWNISVDQTFLLGGMDKYRVLATLRPHIFFDDMRHPHLDGAAAFTPSVHVPFGALNERPPIAKP